MKEMTWEEIQEAALKLAVGEKGTYLLDHDLEKKEISAADVRLAQAGLPKRFSFTRSDRTITICRDK